jgi:hypothetical protein
MGPYLVITLIKSFFLPSLCFSSLSDYIELFTASLPISIETLACSSCRRQFVPISSLGSFELNLEL